MTIHGEAYQNIETGILAATACSPARPEDPTFRGIRINAPQRVTFERGSIVPETRTFVKIPICGYYHLNAIYAAKDPSMLEGMRLVVVNVETKESYIGPVIDCSDTEPTPQTTPFTKEQLEGISTEAYFNPNLVEFVALPEASAVYQVTVELGEKGQDPYFHSNTVTIEILERDAK